jgi:hypothetical protein
MTKLTRTRLPHTGQASAETCERQTISRPPAWPLDLALEDAQLVSEDQELEAEAGVRASAIDEGIREQTEDGIEKSEKHDRASWQVGSSRSAWARRYRVGVS